MRPSSKRTRSSADLRVIFASASSSTPRLDIVHSTRSSRGCIFLSYFPPPRDDELHHDPRSPPLAVPTPISALTRTAQRPCNSYVRYPVAPPSPICCYCGTLEHISRVRRRLERELRFYGQRDLSPVEPRYASQYFTIVQPLYTDGRIPVGTTFGLFAIKTPTARCPLPFACRSRQTHVSLRPEPAQLDCVLPRTRKTDRRGQWGLVCKNGFHRTSSTGNFQLNYGKHSRL